MQEIPKDIKELRLTWDKETLDRLNARKQTLLQQLKSVEGQIKAVEGDMESLQFEPTIEIPINPVRPYE